MSSDNTIPAHEIIEQVDRICQAKDFRNKKMLCSFLSFVVNESLAGRGDQLKGYNIGVQVLGRDAHFDADHDSLVRIHAGRLRRLLQLYYLSEGIFDPIRIEIPKGAYQPFFSLIQPPSQSKDPGFHKSAIFPGHLAHEASILVLPFVNLTNDPAKAYFAFGLSEEISITLTRYEDLKVMNCWQRPVFNDNTKKTLYDELGVRFLIDGSVQIQHAEILVQAKLLDNISGEQVWADSYRRNFSLTNLLDIEQDIAEEIAATIGSEMGIAISVLTEQSRQEKPGNIDVLDAKLRFYYFHAHISEVLMIETFQSLKLALQSDPSSPIIQAMLADMLGNSYALDYPNSENSLEKMSSLAEYALQHAPKNQLVRIVYAYKCFLNDDKERFFQESDHCLQMRINSPGRLASVGFQRALAGDWEKGMAIMDQAMNRHTGYPLYAHGATCLYYYRKKHWERSLEEAIRYDIPGLFWPYLLRTACLGQLGKEKDARANMDILCSLKPGFAQNADGLISRFVKDEECADLILDGLSKAGMHFQNEIKL